jgi:hypothetical protein
MNSGSRTMSRLAAAQQRARAFDYRPGLSCAAKADCQNGKAKSRGALERLPTPYPLDLVWGRGRTEETLGVRPTRLKQSSERPGPKDMND